MSGYKNSAKYKATYKVFQRSHWNVTNDVKPDMTHVFTKFKKTTKFASDILSFELHLTTT